MKSLFTVVPVVLFLSPSFVFADPLLERMEGRWVGRGEKRQLQSGSLTEFASITRSEIRDGALYSHNEITESEDGISKSYVRDYWVRPVVTQSPAEEPSSGVYELGVKNQVTSRGRFDGTAFEVEQDLGLYQIRSRTTFDAQGSTYEETDWYGNHEIIRIRIRYER